MALAVVQATSTEGTSATSVTTTGITTTTGNGIILGISSTSAFSLPAVSDNAVGNVWTKVGELATNGLGPFFGPAPGLAIWYCANITGKVGHTFTSTPGGTPSALSIVAYEVSGELASGTWLDVGGTGATYFAQSGGGAAAGPATLNTPTIATLNAADILFALGVDNGNNAQTQSFTANVGGGTWAIATNGSNNSLTGNPIAAATQIVAATASYSATYHTDATGEPTTCGIASFKAAGGAPAAAPVPQRARMGVGR